MKFFEDSEIINKVFDEAQAGSDYMYHGKKELPQTPEDMDATPTKDTTIKTKFIQFPYINDEYNFTQILFNGALYTVYSSKENPEEFGCEYYMGQNYIVGSTQKSYSRNYKSFDKIPSTQKKIYKKLIEAHNKHYNTNLQA